MIYELEIRNGDDQEFFNPYKQTIEANTSGDAISRVERMNPGCKVWITNTRNSSHGNKGSVSVSNGNGCLPILGLIALVIIGGVAGGGGDDSTPTQTPQAAPVERVQAAPAPVAPAAEPQFRDYASPPPSYCITENFEPC